MFANSRELKQLSAKMSTSKRKKKETRSKKPEF
jgi:hypothetical protein